MVMVYNSNKCFKQVTSKLKSHLTTLKTNNLQKHRDSTANCQQVNYAHIGMYRIYLGAVLGSNGLMSFLVNTSFIKREILPAEVSGTPNLSLSELFVKASPSVNLIHVWR